MSWIASDRSAAGAALATLLVVATLAASFGTAWCGWQTFQSELGQHNFVEVIFEDRDEALWFGTDGGGAVRYDGRTWRAFTTSDGLADNDVIDIQQDRHGNLWLATGEGVTHYDGQVWTPVTTAAGLASDSVFCIVEDRSGNLWFGTYGSGVSRFDGTAWQTLTTADGLAGDFVLTILEDGLGNLWFATEAGLSRYDGTSWQTFLSGEICTAVAEDQTGNLWVATLNPGVRRYDGTSWQTYTTADGLADDDVGAIEVDRFGNVWFGTWGGGVSRFDGMGWRTYTTADGLPDDHVNAVLEDRSGNVWCGGWHGAARYDHESWRTFTSADGLPYDRVLAIAQDGSGNLWFSTRDSFVGGGVTRYDGSSWQTFTTADGLPDDLVHCIAEDSFSNLWFGTSYGVCRYDGTTWRTFTAADGLPSDGVHCIAEDPSGNLWFGTSSGVCRYDGTSWETVSSMWLWEEIAADHSGNIWVTRVELDSGVSRYDGTGWQKFDSNDGLVSDFVLSIQVDDSGHVWLGGQGGVSRYDGMSFQIFTGNDGLAGDLIYSIARGRNGLWFGAGHGAISQYDGTRWWTLVAVGTGSHVQEMLEDYSGNLWFAGYIAGPGEGVVRYEPDRAAPLTVLLNAPPSVSASRTIGTTFAAAFGELAGIQFSHRLDGSVWSAWSELNSWTRAAIPDGSHRFEVRSRDFHSNVDPTPAARDFEIDATPPVPVLESPAYGEGVRGQIPIAGRADDPRFAEYAVEARPTGGPDWDSPEILEIARSTAAVASGPLAMWDTTPLPDGLWEIRLAVADTLGLEGFAQIEVEIDNVPPWASATSPVLLRSIEGGEVYTVAGDVRLYFPPRSFASDVTVLISPASDPEANNPLPADSQCLGAYDVSWGDEALDKAATIEYALDEFDPADFAALAVWLDSGAGWQRLGGTHDAGARRLEAPMLRGGLYALLEGGEGGAPADLFVSLAMTPRVFAPGGSFASRDVAISFSLARDAAVTVKVYNRAGRLVRSVADGRGMRAGLNLVRWDGHDRNGSIVTDGLYVVTVEALGETRKKTLAVVR